MFNHSLLHPFDGINRRATVLIVYIIYTICNLWSFLKLVYLKKLVKILNYSTNYKACATDLFFFLPRKSRFFARLAEKAKKNLGFLGNKGCRIHGKKFNILQENPRSWQKTRCHALGLHLKTIFVCKSKESSFC